MIKKILKIFICVVTLCIVIILANIGYIFGINQWPRTGPDLGKGIVQVADGIATVYLFELNTGKVALIDAGNNPSGAPILEALKQRGKSAEDVEAIFITHAHQDHEAAVGVFPHAKVYAMQEEVEVAAGREPYYSPISRILSAYNPHPFEVTNPLKDLETIQVGDLSVTAYAVPGHTPGSAIYLARGVLFLGDAAGIGSAQFMRGPVWLFSRDSQQGLNSLREFLKKIAPRVSEIAFLTSSHSGSIQALPGFASMQMLVQ